MISKEVLFVAHLVKLVKQSQLIELYPYYKPFHSHHQINEETIQPRLKKRISNKSLWKSSQKEVH